jgi:hypothetical protein
MLDFRNPARSYLIDVYQDRAGGAPAQVERKCVFGDLGVE